MQEKQYFYTINYPVFEKNLCEMEMKYLFKEVPNERYFFSDYDINPSRSAFIKDRINILYREDTLDKILNRVIEDKVSYENFKICYVTLKDGDIDYKTRLESIRAIGLIINGQSEMHNPDVTLALTKVNGKWIFGEYERNDYEWHIHDDKPYSYSNSLGIRVAKALVNIAIGSSVDKKLIDPCCGVGTVVIEALSMNFDVKGYEIKKPIAANARKNLEFFGYDKDIITSGDMHTIKEKYDVAIIDLPYGLFTPTTLQEQIDIMKTARRITDKLVIVTFEDMKEDIEAVGFKIIDRCNVCKGKFKRYIDICE